MLRGYESGQPRSRFMRRLGPPTRDPPGDSTLPRIGTMAHAKGTSNAWIPSGRSPPQAR